jgi:hypothetical protein
MIHTSAIQHELPSNVDATIVELGPHQPQIDRDHNAQSPLCRLPTEILMVILCLMRDPVLAFSQLYSNNSLDCLMLEDESSPSDNDGLRWTSIMLVCTRLREVALACPELWNVIHLRHPTSWNNLCVERSSGNNVSVIGPSPRHGALDAYVPRAHRLRLHVEDKYIQTEAWAQYDCLDQLNIKLKTLIYHCYIPSFRLPSTLPGGRHEYLQVVVLREVELEGHLQLPSLVRLELSRVVGVDVVDSILHIVSHAPRLQFLRLSLRETGTGADYERHMAQYPSLLLPDFHVLIIKANAVDTYVLLLILPHPIQKLRVDLNSRTRRSEMEWSELSELHQAALVGRVLSSATSRSGSDVFARACVIGEIHSSDPGSRYILDLDDDGRTHFTIVVRKDPLLRLFNLVRIIYLDDYNIPLLADDWSTNDWFTNAQSVVITWWDEDIGPAVGAKLGAWLAHRAEIGQHIIAVDIYDGRSTTLEALARSWKDQGLIKHLILDGDGVDELARVNPSLGYVRSEAFGMSWFETMRLAQKLRLSPPSL